MATQVLATMVGSMLKPDQASPLAEHTCVQLTIEPLFDKRDAAAAWQSLKARLRERPIHGSGERFTRNELHERR